MFDQIRTALADLRFVDEVDLDARAVEEIARFIRHDQHDLDHPGDPDELARWIKEHDDHIDWLYEYLTTSSNVIYGGSR